MHAAPSSVASSASREHDRWSRSPGIGESTENRSRSRSSQYSPSRGRDSREGRRCARSQSWGLRGGSRSRSTDRSRSRGWRRPHSYSSCSPSAYVQSQSRSSDRYRARQARQNVRDLLSLCRSLRVVINEGKSDLITSQTANFLSVTIDTRAPGFFRPLCSREISVGGRDVLCYVRSPSSAFGRWFWTPGFAGEAGSTQPPSNVLSAVAFESALVSRVGSALPPGTSVPGGEGGSALADGAGPSSHGGLIWDTCSGSAPVFGCVSVGMGRTPPRSFCVQGVVGGEVVAHQPSQNEGDVSGIAVSSGGGRRSSCNRDVRQLDGGGVRQQAGRDGLPLPLLVGQPASEVDGESRRPP